MEPLAVALEIGGTKLQAALGTYDGTIVERVRGDAPRNGEIAQILDWFAKHVSPLIAGAEAKVGGIGIGFGGPVDSGAEEVLLSHQVAGWEGYPLRAWSEELFELPTTILNDANAAGWGEFRRGAGRGTRTFCYMNVGSGIGGALIIDGKLHDGQGLGAFEIGHTLVPGPRGAERLQAAYSGWSIERRLRDGPPLGSGTELYRLCEGDRGRITCEILATAARSGDTVALVEIDDIARALGLAIANAITLVHPERFVLGGGVSLMGDILFEPLRGHVEAYVFEQFKGQTELLPAELGEDVVLVGGLLLAGR